MNAKYLTVRLALAEHSPRSNALTSSAIPLTRAASGSRQLSCAYWDESRDSRNKLVNPIRLSWLPRPGPDTRGEPGQLPRARSLLEMDLPLIGKVGRSRGSSHLAIQR